MLISVEGQWERERISAARCHVVWWTTSWLIPLWWQQDYGAMLYNRNMLLLFHAFPVKVWQPITSVALSACRTFLLFCVIMKSSSRISVLSVSSHFLGITSFSYSSNGLLQLDCSEGIPSVSNVGRCSSFWLHVSVLKTVRKIIDFFNQTRYFSNK